tara:strand:- start:6975 stop:7403 length:429 start_codon:yes stop_codon:yes gene_type:complete
MNRRLGWLKILGLALLFGINTACQRCELNTIEETTGPKPIPVEAVQAAAERPQVSPPEIIEPNTEDESRAVQLNLDLPRDIVATGDQAGNVLFNEQSKLPDLFGSEKSQNSTSVSTRLLRDEDNPDVVDSIDGLGVHIERKL